MTPDAAALDCRTIEAITPLDAQMGVHPTLFVPAALRDEVFDPTGEAETFALLDGAKVRHIEQVLDDDLLTKTCLFQGNALEDMGDVAPWLVKLPDNAMLTRRLFTHSDDGSDLWAARPGVLLQSSASLDELRGHFRRYVKLRNPADKWFYFRFWEPYVMYGLAAEGTPIGRQICAPLSRVIAPLDRHTVGIIDNPSPPSVETATAQLTPQASAILSSLRANHMLTTIAEALWDSHPPSAGQSAQNWRGYADQMTAWGQHARRQYGLNMYKTLHSYLMLRHAMPDTFDLHAAGIENILLAQTPQEAKVDALIGLLRTV